MPHRYSQQGTQRRDLSRSRTSFPILIFISKTSSLVDLGLILVRLSVFDEPSYRSLFDILEVEFFG